MTSKLPLNDILAAIDMNAKTVWKELDDDEKKQINFWLLNRFASSVAGSREKQELAVLKTNEFYNKHFNSLGVSKDNGHPELLWQLLCMSGSTGTIERHNWIALGKKATNTNNKAVHLIEKIYPHLRSDEAQLLASISTKKELKRLAEDHGIENVKL